jgi:hypothetical protein
MYTNPSNIIKTLTALLERNSIQINQVVQQFLPSKSLNVFEGVRTLLPADAYPSLEIEPTNGTNQWATTRAQRPRFNFNCTLTTLCDNEKFAVEYMTTLATILVTVMTDPQNLQMPVIGETRWDATGGLYPTIILDSLVEDVSYNAEKDGTLRKCEFSWFAVIHEPYPDIKFRIGESSSPTVLRPVVVV